MDVTEATEATDVTDVPDVDDVTPMRPATGAGFNLKWAMIVPGLGVLILFIFIGGSFLTANPVQQIKTGTTPITVNGSALKAVPARVDLTPIIIDGQPPGNIINATDIPDGSTRLSWQNNSAAAQQYDAQIQLRSDASQGALESFYRKDMKAQGWQIFEVGPADHDANAIEVLGKLAGSDGFYWEMGAVIHPTTFGSHAPPTGWTQFTVRLFQVPDPD
jgi:hypothetical protein